MTIETPRLELVCLSARQLRLLTEDLGALERELRCIYRAEPIEGFFLKILKGQIPVTEQDAANAVWHSFWLLVRRSDRTVVGSADFKDLPNAQREVEIGYGLGKAFEHCGYMTEAVEALCAWALAQKGVECVTAETECGNLASRRVLQRCGFCQYARGETLWWRLCAN